MVIVIDIGNTNMIIGAVEGDELSFTLRLRSDRNKTEDEYEFAFRGMLQSKGASPENIEGGIISSVVPELRPVVRDVMERITGKKFLLVGSGIKTGLNIRMDDPAGLGADLVVNSVAALSKYAPPLVIFDVGTATTMAVIDKNGSYIGGQIVPGLRISVDALSAKAAQLPYVDLEVPADFIGSNTIASMQAGAIYGHAAMIDGLLERAEQELEQPTEAVITGGLAAKVVPFCKRSLHYHENLMLEGLKIIYDKNKGRIK